MEGGGHMLRFEEVAPDARLQYLDLLLVGDEDPAMLQRYLHQDYCGMSVWCTPRNIRICWWVPEMLILIIFGFICAAGFDLIRFASIFLMNIVSRFMLMACDYRT